MYPVNLIKMVAFNARRQFVFRNIQTWSYELDSCVKYYGNSIDVWTLVTVIYMTPLTIPHAVDVSLVTLPCAVNNTTLVCQKEDPLPQMKFWNYISLEFLILSWKGKCIKVCFLSRLRCLDFNNKPNWAFYKNIINVNVFA